MSHIIKSILSGVKYIPLISVLSISTALASGFDKFNFAIEYSGAFADGERKKDGKQGGSNKSYQQEIEINNELFMKGDKVSHGVGLDIFIDKNIQRRDGDTAHEKDKLNTTWQIRHRAVWHLENRINVSVQNALRFIEKPNGAQSRMWELRGLVNHSTTTGVYKYSRAELSYRRYFKQKEVNTMRLRLDTRFRTPSQKIDIFARASLYADFANKNDINAGRYVNNGYTPPINREVNDYFFRTGGGFKYSYTTIFVGPEYNTDAGSTFYVYAYGNLGGQTLKKDNAKGLLLGYSTSIDLAKN